MILQPARVDSVIVYSREPPLLLLEYVGDEIFVDERGVFLPDLQLRVAKTRRAFRRLERDRACAFDVTDLACNARNVCECAALRKADQKIPVFEQIERRIEAAEIEEGVAGDKDRGQRNVIVDEKQLAIEVLPENAHA